MPVVEDVDQQVHGDDGDVLVVVGAGARRDEQRVEERHPRQVVGQGDPGQAGEREQLVGVALEVVGGGPQHEPARRPRHEAIVAQRADGVLPRQGGQQAIEVRRLQDRWVRHPAYIGRRGRFP